MIHLSLSHSPLCLDTRARAQSVEELELLWVSESLTPAQRLEALLAPSAHAVQRVSAVEQVAGVVEAHGEAVFVRVARLLRDLLEESTASTSGAAHAGSTTRNRVIFGSSADHNAPSATEAEGIDPLLVAVPRLLAAAYRDVLRSESLRAKTAASTLMSHILDVLCDAHGDFAAPNLRAAAGDWLEAARALVGALSRKELRNVLRRAQRQTQMARPRHERVVGCLLLGAVAAPLAACASESEVEADVGSRLSELLHDLEREVRLCAIRTAATLGPALSGRVEDLFLAGLAEACAEDGDPEAEAAALAAVCALVPYLTPAAVAEVAAPVVVAAVGQARGSPSRAAALVGLLGPFLVSACDALDADSVATLLSFYQSQALGGIRSATRLEVARNLPGVVAAAGPARFATWLSATLQRLVSDSDVDVRRTIAAGLHEVAARISAGDARSYVHPAVQALLADPAVDVRAAVLAHLEVIFASFDRGGDGSRTSEGSGTEDHRSDAAIDGGVTVSCFFFLFVCCRCGCGCCWVVWTSPCCHSPFRFTSYPFSPLSLYVTNPRNATTSSLIPTWSCWPAQ